MSAVVIHFVARVNFAGPDLAEGFGVMFELKLYYGIQGN